MRTRTQTHTPTFQVCYTFPSAHLFPHINILVAPELTRLGTVALFYFFDLFLDPALSRDWLLSSRRGCPSLMGRQEFGEHLRFLSLSPGCSFRETEELLEETHLVQFSSAARHLLKATFMSLEESAWEQ